MVMAHTSRCNDANDLVLIQAHNYHIWNILLVTRIYLISSIVLNFIEDCDESIRVRIANGRSSIVSFESNAFIASNQPKKVNWKRL